MSNLDIFIYGFMFALGWYSVQLIFALLAAILKGGKK